MRTVPEAIEQASPSSKEGEVNRQPPGLKQPTALPERPYVRRTLEELDRSLIQVPLAVALLLVIADLFRSQPDPARNIGNGLAVLLAGLNLVVAYRLRRREWISPMLFAFVLLFWRIGPRAGPIANTGLAILSAVLLIALTSALVNRLWHRHR